MPMIVETWRLGSRQAGRSKGDIIYSTVHDTMDFVKRDNLDKLWRKVRLDRGIDIECWSAPVIDRPYKPLTSEQKARRNRTRFTNKMKKRFPLFAEQFINERYGS